MFSTDPDYRRQYTDGLRQLADYLDANPGVPVPAEGTGILLIAADAEEGGLTQVFDLSVKLAVPLTEHDGFYRAARRFGPVTYTGVSQTRAQLARYRAYGSYYGCVTPDD